MALGQAPSEKTTNILNFPTKLPTPQQVELPRASLSGILQELTIAVMKCYEDVLKADSASELAAAVRKTAEVVGEASAGWSELRNTVRDSWGI